MSSRLAFIAGAIAGMGRARRRIALIAFLGGVVVGICLGVAAGIGLGVGLRRKTRDVLSGSRPIDSVGT
jgi:hypothetical protein